MPSGGSPLAWCNTLATAMSDSNRSTNAAHGIWMDACLPARVRCRRAAASRLTYQTFAVCVDIRGKRSAWENGARVLNPGRIGAQLRDGKKVCPPELCFVSRRRGQSHDLGRAVWRGNARGQVVSALDPRVVLRPEGAQSERRLEGAI